MDLQELLNLGVLQIESLSDYIINTVPETPTRIADMGLFESDGLYTDLYSLQLDEITLSLVPTAPRGAPGRPASLGRLPILTAPPSNPLGTSSQLSSYVH